MPNLFDLIPFDSVPKSSDF